MSTRALELAEFGLMPCLLLCQLPEPIEFWTRDPSGHRLRFACGRSSPTATPNEEEEEVWLDGDEFRALSAAVALERLPIPDFEQLCAEKRRGREAPISYEALLDGVYLRPDGRLTVAQFLAALELELEAIVWPAVHDAAVDLAQAA